MGKTEFDVVVIGGGPAGLAAAEALAENPRRKVALVEEKDLGGQALASRDLPLRAANAFSHLYASAIRGQRYGISSKTLRFNYPSVRRYVKKTCDSVRNRTKSEFSESNLTILKGKAHLLDAHTISVGGQGGVAIKNTGNQGITTKGIGGQGASATKNTKSQGITTKKLADNHGVITTKKIIIATGSAWKDPGISGTSVVNFYTPETALNIDRIPRTVMIVGGGASGVELAQYFSEMGSKVAIAELSERLLPREDLEVGTTMKNFLEKRFDVKVLTSTRVIALEENAVTKRVLFLNGGSEKMVQVEAIILATGSAPTTDLGLENTGVAFDARGIKVDKTLRTNVKNIFAAGDVIGGDSSPEKAIYQGGLAALNLSGGKNYANYDGFMRVVETDPQVAVIGLTEDDLVKRGRHYKSVVVPLSEAPAAQATDSNFGFLKLITDKKGLILGATMVSPHATESLQELAVMMRHNFSVLEVASTPHPTFAYTELIRQAAHRIV